jgi:hypothetical protein
MPSSAPPVLGRRLRPAGTLVALAILVVQAPAAPAPGRDPCGPGNVTTDVRYGRPVCIHRSEPPPPGVDAHRRPSTDDLRARHRSRHLEALAAAPEAVAAAAESVACLGDGQDGVRVQAVYARAADVPDRFDAVAPLIAGYAADVDLQIAASAALSGAGRRVRFATGPGCALDVARVTLTPAGDDSFSAMRAELQAQGFARADRKYLVWVDAAIGICGLGEMYRDDRPGPDNANNRGPSYARIDAPCWGYAEAHELIHMLGGVQDSAPHATPAGHCTDENDTMCYRDSPGIVLTVPCPSLPAWNVDCNLDDYFNAAPPPSSYLAEHWNVATSAWLETTDPPQAPALAAVVPGVVPAGTPVAVAARVDVPAGRAYEVTWASSRPDCWLSPPTGSTTVLTCRPEASGAGIVAASVADALGMRASAAQPFQVTPVRRATSLGLSLSTQVLRRGRRVAVRGRLGDAGGGWAAAGVRVTLWTRRPGARRWTAVASRATDAAGRVSFSLRPSRTALYRLTSASTPAWAPSTSATRRVTVRRR